MTTTHNQSGSTAHTPQVNTRRPIDDNPQVRRLLITTLTLTTGCVPLIRSIETLDAMMQKPRIARMRQYTADTADDNADTTTTADTTTPRDAD